MFILFFCIPIATRANHREGRIRRCVPGAVRQRRCVRRDQADQARRRVGGPEEVHHDRDPAPAAAEQQEHRALHHVLHDGDVPQHRHGVRRERVAPQDPRQVRPLPRDARRRVHVPGPRGPRLPPRPGRRPQRHQGREPPRHKGRDDKNSRFRHLRNKRLLRPRRRLGNTLLE